MARVGPVSAMIQIKVGKVGPCDFHHAP